MCGAKHLGAKCRFGVKCPSGRNVPYSFNTHTHTPMCWGESERLPYWKVGIQWQQQISLACIPVETICCWSACKDARIWYLDNYSMSISVVIQCYRHLNGLKPTKVVLLLTHKHTKDKYARSVNTWRYMWIMGETGNAVCNMYPYRNQNNFWQNQEFNIVFLVLTMRYFDYRLECCVYISVVPINRDYN
jgi:hypothetical protein